VRGLSFRTYAAAAGLAAPGLRWMLQRRVARGKEVAERLAEREGVEQAPRPPGRLLWLHAASVGETVSVLPVIQSVADDATILMTTGTITSARLLAERLPALGLADRVLHRFVPLDVPGWAARFLDHWRPDAAAFVESELWPNLIAACAARGIPMALVNARMSERSFAQWRRYLPGLARGMLGAFAAVQAKSPEDAERLRLLGAQAVTAPGDLKFAAPPLPVDEDELARLRGALNGRPVWLAASTHPGEERLVAAAHARIAAGREGLLTIIAPRHPDRGAAIAAELGGVRRRGAGEAPPAGGIWLADTLGELGLFYRLTGMAFMGKSLAGQGGQNPLEPARLGCAVAVGPHTGNFTNAVAVLAEAGGLAQVADEGELASWAGAMLADPARRQAVGRAAQEAAGRYAGLPAETAAMLRGLMDRR
jgi:3-deoxy-D-manno-octulosonic-acid transferase